MFDRDYRQGIMLSLVTAGMLGIGATLAKYALEKINPVFLAFLDLFLGFFLFAPFVLLRRKALLPRQASKKELNILLKLAISGTAIPLVLILYGLELTSSIQGAFLIQLQSIFGIILARILLKETVLEKQRYGLFLIIAGSFLIILRDPQSILDFFRVKGLLGDLLIVSGAIGLGYSYVLSKKLALKIEPELVVSFRLFAGWLFLIPLLPILLITGIQLIDFSPHLFLTTFFYIVTNFCIAYVTMQMALEILPSWMVAAFTQIMPLFTVATSFFFLRESITALVILGGILILLGGFILLMQIEKHNSPN